MPALLNREIFWRRASLTTLLLCLFVAAILGGAGLRRRRPLPAPPHLFVQFVDVGAGDCTLIQTPQGQTILVDTGGAGAAGALQAALQARRVRQIDLLILAAPAASRIGGVPALLDSGLPVRAVWDNAVRDPSQAHRAAVEAIRRRHIPSRIAHAGDAWANLAVAWPPENGPSARADALVCRLQYGSTTLLLLGSAGGGAESRLVSSAGEELACDLIQTADGGSDAATSFEMLRRAGPSAAVICCDAARPPAPGTLHRLQAAGAAIWSTDARGAVSVLSDGRTPPVITAARL